MYVLNAIFFLFAQVLFNFPLELLAYPNNYCRNTFDRLFNYCDILFVAKSSQKNLDLQLVDLKTSFELLTRFQNSYQLLHNSLNFPCMECVQISLLIILNSNRKTFFVIIENRSAFTQCGLWIVYIEIPILILQSYVLRLH